MFEVPGAKRVRRDEILSRTSTSRSPSPSAEGEAEIELPETAAQDVHQRLGQLLNLDSLLAGVDAAAGRDEQNTKQNENEDEDEEQEFEFRLFSAPATGRTAAAEDTKDNGKDKDGAQAKLTEDNKETTQKLRIRLRSPTPGPADLSEGRFVRPFRGWEYYFTVPGLLTGTEDAGSERAGLELKRKQFEDVAVTGQNVMEWASAPWPGCHLPWRVIHLKRHRSKSQRKTENSAAAPAVYVAEPNLHRTPTTRRKPGKKRRVQLRKRLEAAETAKQEDAEKRTRKNRERKIKRRQKNRDMKAAAVAAGEDVAMADDVSSEGDD